MTGCSCRPKRFYPFVVETYGAPEETGNDVVNEPNATNTGFDKVPVKSLRYGWLKILVGQDGKIRAVKRDGLPDGDAAMAGPPAPAAAAPAIPAPAPGADKDNPFN